MQINTKLTSNLKSNGTGNIADTTQLQSFASDAEKTSFASMLQSKSTVQSNEASVVNSSLDTINSSEPTIDDLRKAKNGKSDEEVLRQSFQDFVGQTFFSQMIASMRSTQNEPAYFHGGQAEKIFQGQLDQIMSEEMSKTSAAQFSDPMFKLFQLRRQ